MLDVTELFDAFHRVVSALWREFGRELAATDEDEDVASFDELVDQLELDVFLPACARRLRQATGEQVGPDEIAARIRLVAEESEPLPGAAWQYHSHAFHPDSAAGDVPHAILTASLMSVPRPGIRLQLVSTAGPGDRVRNQRRDLPVH